MNYFKQIFSKNQFLNKSSLVILAGTGFAYYMHNKYYMSHNILK